MRPIWTLDSALKIAAVIAVTAGFGGCLDMIYGWHYDQTRAGGNRPRVLSTVSPIRKLKKSKSPAARTQLGCAPHYLPPANAAAG